MLFKSAEIVFLSATLHTQKKVKESLYFDLLPGPLKSATLFFIYIRNKREKEDYSGHIFYLFVFSLTSYS